MMKYITDKLIWQPNAYNVRGQVTNYLRGTNLVTQKYYDGYGFQTGDLTSSTGVGTYAYNSCDFDEIKWNLLSQPDHLAIGFNCKTRNFTYDSFNWLTHETISGNSLQSVFGNNRMNLAENDAMLLKKIEELTLYILQQGKKIENLETELGKLKENK